METYKCNKCGMAVNASCPSCEGKIKSSQCCGEDMMCEF